MLWPIPHSNITADPTENTANRLVVRNRAQMHWRKRQYNFSKTFNMVVGSPVGYAVALPLERKAPFLTNFLWFPFNVRVEQ
jgi:hypothetical protein